MAELSPDTKSVSTSAPPVAALRGAGWDKAGIGLSAACVVHCTTLPMLVALSPSLFGGLLNDANFHRWLLVLILPTAVLAFGLSWWRHRRWSILLPGLVGLGLLGCAALLGHDGPLGEWGEKLLTFAGGLALISGHALNLMRRG